MVSYQRFLVVACCLTSIPGLTEGQSTPAGTQPAQWRIVWKDDPATQALIAWNTVEPGQAHVLRMRPKSSASIPFQEIKAGRNGEFSYRDRDESPLYYHDVELTGLQPATEYELEMVSDGHISPRFYFRTAPDGPADFSLLFGGDSRSDHPQRREMNRLMAHLVEAGSQTESAADDVLSFDARRRLRSSRYQPDAVEPVDVGPRVDDHERRSTASDHSGTW